MCQVKVFGFEQKINKEKKIQVFRRPKAIKFNAITELAICAVHQHVLAKLFETYFSTHFFCSVCPSSA